MLNINAAIATISEISIKDFDNIKEIEEKINFLNEQFLQFKKIEPEYFWVREKSYKVLEVSKETKDFYNRQTNLPCVEEVYTQGYSGEILRYYLVDDSKAISSAEKALVEQLLESGGAFVNVHLELIFVLKSHYGKMAIFHESGHIKFMREGAYKKVAYKSETSYEAYISEEIYADNWGIANLDPEDRAEGIKECIKDYLNIDKIQTSLFHFPRIMNLWEKYKEAVSA